MQIKSVKIDAVIVTAGSRSKKPNTVNLVVDNEDAIAILKLYELQQKGEDPTEGIKAVKILFEYVEEDGAPESDKLELEIVEEDIEDESGGEVTL